MSDQLKPAPHPIGLLETFTRHGQTVALKIHEKHFTVSKDSFDITDAFTGATVLHVSGKVFSVHGRKEIKDPAGNILFQMHKEHFHLHTTFQGTDAADQVIFTVRASVVSLGADLSMTYHNPMTDRDEELKLDGDFFDRKAEITCDGRPIGHISRKFLNAGQILWDDQTYILSVAPGVDCALLAAFCVCLDEKANDGIGR